VAVSKI